MILGVNGIIAGKGLSIPLLLNIYTGAYAAYSLRKLSNIYTGNAITVRRSSDNTSTNIGFDANGNLDTAPLLSFVGTGSAFITTWFDQSGNNRNLTQTTNNSQPRIVNNGVVDLLKGKPSVYISSSKFMKIDFGTTLSQPLTYFNIGSSGNVANQLISAFSGSGVNITAQGGAVRIADTSNLNFSYTNNIATQRLIYALANTTTSRIAVNAATGSSGNIGTNGINGITLAASPTGTFSFEQNHQELILWNADKTTDRTGISNNINSYYGTY